MPRAYLVAVCSSSAIDRDSNEFSLFGLSEAVIVDLANGEATGGLQIHSYWLVEPSEIGAPLDLQFKYRTETGEYDATPVFQVAPDSRRFRIRILGLRLPPVYGPATLHTAWRATGSTTWMVDPLGYPFEVVPPLPVTLPPARE